MNFRVLGLWSAVGAVIAGVILADFVHNPKGTKVLANATVNTEKVAVGGLLGKAS